jgi:hypothetical protein
MTALIGSRASRIFSTNIRVRVAGPCSFLVAAMHQLLTQIFELILLVLVLCNQQFYHYGEGFAILNNREKAGQR